MKKGQTAIEYILLATCVIAVLIVFLMPHGKMFHTIDAGINATVDQIGDMAEATNFLCAVIPDDGGGGGGGNDPPPPPVNCYDYNNSKISCMQHGTCMWVTLYGLGCHPTTSCKPRNPDICDVYAEDGTCCISHAGCLPCP